MIEQGIDYSFLLAALPVVAITVNQAKAIFSRDNNQCTFPIHHDCHGKLTVHHIHGKDDSPENLATVCHEAHWGHLHNGASQEDKLEWAARLFAIVHKRTTSAHERGWIFPED